jgi:hypothetical protein
MRKEKHESHKNKPINQRAMPFQSKRMADDAKNGHTYKYARTQHRTETKTIN